MIGGSATDKGIISTLAVSDDVRFRSRDGDVHFFQPADDTWDTAVDVDSDDDVYPVILIEPGTAKSSGYQYKRFVPVVWKAQAGATTYPIELGELDTSTLVSAGKMQADGDDLRVYSDGVEIDRWLADMNTATTDIWANFDFEASQSASLTDAMGSGDTVTEIEVDDDISGFPSAGILLIDSEVFVYTDKSNALKKFTGVTREAKGTSAAAHTSGDTVWWIQHDVWILYGNGSATAPTVDDDYKPAFELDNSSNDSWDYEEFNDDNEKMAGGWSYETEGTGTSSSSDDPDIYTANQDSDASPWEETGAKTPQYYETVRWWLYNPCGVTAINYTNGEKRADNNRTYFQAYVQSSGDGSAWTTEYTIPVPSSGSTWEAWSQNVTGISGAYWISLYLDNWQNITGTFYVEVADATVTLNSTYTPDSSIGSEQSNYPLAVTITNDTTGDAIKVEMDIATNEILEIDTWNRTVTYQDDGSNQISALTLVGGVRKHWFRLEPGENNIEWSDTGTAEVNVALIWDRRYYD